MFKKLLTLSAVAATVVSANAFDLPLDALESGWNSEYDAATHTITYSGAWSGRGWWLDNVDYSAYDKVVIEIEPAAITAQLNIEYVAEGAPNSSSGLCEIGATTISVPLNPNCKNAVKQMYIQCGPLTSDPTITIKSAQVVSNDGDSSVLWEGTYTASGWNAGATIPSYMVKAGDVLTYYMTPGNDNAQVIMKSADWANLLGTSKITNSAIFDGTVTVVVTDEMLSACGGSIFLQGDGGISCTKVELTGTMEIEEDIASILNFGRRSLPTEIFCNINADEANYLMLAFDGKPSWLQVCNSSWTTLIDNESATVFDEALTYMVFPLNEEIIAGINANNQMVINGDNSVTYYGALLLNEIPNLNDEPLYTVGNEDNTTGWWSAWSPTAVLVGDGTIHYDFTNYSDEVNFWDNWIAVFVNGDYNPAVEGYGIENELLVLRADNWGWGPLYDRTVLTNDYDWDNFKQDMNGADVSLDVKRAGQEMEMVAEIVAVDGSIYTYTAKTTGLTSEALGVFLTVEGGHLDVYNVTVTGASSISDIADDDTPVHYYNINGIEVSGTNIPAGMYIMKQGTKTSKVYIR